MLGENATGKSTVLEAVTLAAMPEVVFSDLQSELSQDHKLVANRHILDPKFLGSPKAMVPEEAKVELTFENDEGRPHKRSLRINASGFHHSVENNTDNFLIFAYGAHRLFGKSSQGREVKISDSVITLFRNDLMTIDPQTWMINLDQKDTDSLNEVVRALRHVVQLDGDFESININENGQEKPFCQINIKRTRTINSESQPGTLETEAYTVPTPLSYVSSGYRVIIALICDVIKGIMDRLDVDAYTARRCPALIIIDEIEAHLHPRWKLEIISGLRKALPGATFILSSHDPLCVRGMRNGEVIVFNRYFNDRQPAADQDKLVTREVVETITEFPDFEALTVEQLLTSDLFQLHSANDRRMEKGFADVAQILEREKAGRLEGDDEEVLRKFRSMINKALPIGMTEAESVVQDAVADYLALRRNAPQDDVKAARNRARKTILDRLQKITGRPQSERDPS